MSGQIRQKVSVFLGVRTRLGLKQSERDFTSFLPPLSPFHVIFSLLSPRVCTQTLGIDHLKSSSINPTPETCSLRINRRFHRLV
jgi:hypothetical protein